MNLLDDIKDVKLPEEERGGTSGSSGNNIFLEKNTTLYHNGTPVGTLDTISHPSRCDCPGDASAHDDGKGEDYAFTVQLSGGDIGIKCGGSHCDGVTYLPSKELTLEDKRNYMQQKDLESFTALPVDVNKNSEYALEYQTSMCTPIEKERQREVVHLLSMWLSGEKTEALLEELNEKMTIEEKEENIGYFINHDKFDFVFLDVVSGKFVFTKESTVIKHNETGAKNLIDKKTLASVPRLKHKYFPRILDRLFTDPMDGLTSYNSFSPTKFYWRKTEPTSPESIYFLIDHLCKDQPEIKEQLLDALSFHLKTSMAIHLGWIFVGIEGAGKGIFMDVISLLFGSHNFTKRRLSDFTGLVVKGVTNAQVCFIDENIPADKSEEVVESLKGIIGNSQFVSRAMREDAVTADNFTMYFFATNNFGLKLSQNDRRFNLISTPTQLINTVGDVSVFRDKVLSDGAVQSFYNDLMKRDVTIDKVNHIIESDFRTSTIEERMTIEELIAKCIIHNTLDPILEKLEFEPNGITGDEEDLTEQLQNIYLQRTNFKFVSSANIKEVAENIARQIPFENFTFKYQNCRTEVSKKWGSPVLKSINNDKFRAYTFE